MRSKGMGVCTRTFSSYSGKVSFRLPAAVSTALTARMPKNMKQQKLLFSQIGSMFIDFAAGTFSNIPITCIRPVSGLRQAIGIEGRSATQRESLSKK